MIHFVRLVIGLFWLSAAAWGQPLTSIKSRCNGALSAPMAQTAALYQSALAALNGSEAGWCAIASEMSSEVTSDMVMWELSSAAYVLHALRGRKELNPMQQTAMRELLSNVPGMGTPPTRLRQIDSALYVHIRTLAAQDSTDTMVALDVIKQHSPTVYKTLIKRSIRWGDADDN